jgi:prepilin-type processing-associated H-X9-DG protein
LFYLVFVPGNHRRGGAKRSQCKNNLKQIGLALHNYHDRYGCFPPAFIADGKGRPMHSWRVLLLPYLDQGPLYNLYRFDEPWDGPNNRKLADRSVEVYHCPEGLKKTSPASEWTSYVAVVGPNTAWPDSSSRALADFQDPTSETLLVVELADSGIHWMDPRDLHVVQMSPLISSQAGQGISSKHNGGAQAVLADGSVRFFSQNLSGEAIHGLLTVNGGETIGDF